MNPKYSAGPRALRAQRCTAPRVLSVPLLCTQTSDRDTRRYPIAAIELLDAAADLRTHQLQFPALELVALLQEPQYLADDLAGGGVETALYLVVDELLELGRQRDVHL